MHTFPASLALVIATIVTVIMSTSAGHIYIYDGANADGYYLDWAFHDTQRCYSVPCFNDRTHSIVFRKLPDGGHLVLYEDTACRGKHYTVAATPRGKLEYKDGGFEFGISSFMVWSSGIYATNGLTNICKDHPKERAVNSTTGVLDDAGH
ncbi:hypothetical protein PF005_g18598 [Phytophthora fragariae]|uniref:Phytocyanin domain-containing protein n=1 Tax=Phytophthora fragariae TaxID=53985 RepID=A0A6A3Y8N9_9STRA|nr:hypothetical protein PF009_g18265 [Phytophthora fragariae]KAE8992831.1 hypothetical protein PF011_g17390 [Phytophthora fragariae]KAE9092630.1 hypothetical protein PF010_g17778 [Phytophthora fragariae]KAE9097671.1 hypothetical protein PF007_g16543 [Phytophthora fragariae]KAE9122811.1 hypothetical protein PF006_g17569 [Phytophthora fragariae]